MITTIPALPVPSPFNQLPSDLVEAALAMLCEESIPLIPWGPLLYKSMNVPKVILYFQFLVPDELLDIASHKVSAMHLPLTPPPPLLLKTEGDLISKGYLHRLTHDTDMGSVQYLHLLPLSFAGFRPSEWSKHHTPNYSLYVPRPSSVYASVFRLIASYPRKGPVRSTLIAELELLVNYHLLDLPRGYRVPEDDEEWDESDMRAREESAVRVVRSWAVDGEWRDGEEWMGDALLVIVGGSGDLDYLPWRSQ